MAKKVKTILKLQLEGGNVNPGPPLGPTLGQHGIGIQDFVNRFNEATKNLRGVKVGVILTVYEDRSFDFTVGGPLTTYLLKKAAGIEKGSGSPKLNKAASISRAKLEEIAKEKMRDLNARDLAQAVRIIEGTARSMGIEVK